MEISAADLDPPSSTQISEADLDPVPGQNTFTPAETTEAEAANLFGGALPIVGGVVNKLRYGGTYAENRDKWRQAMDEAEQANPKAAFVGKVGRLIPETLVGGAVGEGLGAGAEAIGAADKVAELSPYAQTAAKYALGGAGYGAANAATTAVSQGKSFGDTVKDTLAATAAGGVLGGSAGVLGKAVADKVVAPILDKAQRYLGDKYAQTFGSEVLGLARPRDKSAWADILGKEPEQTGAEEAIKAKDYVQSRDVAPIERAAHAKDYDKAIAATDSLLDQMRPTRVANYQALDDVTGGFRVGDADNRLTAAEFLSRNGPRKDDAITHTLASAREAWRRDYATADANVLSRALNPVNTNTPVSTELSDALNNLRNKLPNTGPITRTVIQEAVQDQGNNPEVINYVNKHVLDPDTGILTWNPDAKISSVELRDVASQAQDNANKALGRFNGTQAAEKTNAVKKAINGSLEDYLDATANSNSKTSQVVKDIRNNDVKYSVLLSAKSGLKQAIQKTNVNDLGPLKILGSSANALRYAAPVVAIHRAEAAKKDAGEGNYFDAALNAGEAVAAGAYAAPLVARIAARYGNKMANSDVVRQLISAAKAGVPKAVTILSGLVGSGGN